MMSSVVVMVTVSDRLPMLNNFLRSLDEHEPGRAVAVHMQGDNLLDQIEWPDGMEIALTMHSRERMGCHAARVLLQRRLRGIGYDSYINVDDDVTLIEHTNWQTAIDKAHEPGVGFVLTNWIKHVNGLPKAISIMEEEFVPAVFVYQGGGMVYGEDVAELMRDLSAEPARYDDIWPLTTYLNGYRNYRYRGSLAIHGIMQKGGMNAYMKAEPRPLLCWDWVDYRYLFDAPVGKEYSIPTDSDLKPEARERHKEARAAKGWA